MCGELLSDNKPTKDPVHSQTNQDEPDETEVATSAEKWDQMYDPTPTNRKALTNGWMQVRFLKLYKLKIKLIVCLGNKAKFV